jgi:hypothetical protein
MRQGKRNGAPPSPGSPVRGATGGEGDAYRMSKRLSATDISALASMKNVAKCDTWCELQNPVNHRVFERKLRPKPLGRGHACLGVTHRVAPSPPAPGGGRGGDWPPVRSDARGRPKPESAVDATSRPVVVEASTRVLSRPDAPSARRGRTQRSDRESRPRPRPQVRRDHPLSLSISISGGKETYKDSPSNGERTGNSPT